MRSTKGTIRLDEERSDRAPNMWLEVRIIVLTPIVAAAVMAPEFLAAGRLIDLVCSTLAAATCSITLALAVRVLRRLVD